MSIAHAAEPAPILLRSDRDGVTTLTLNRPGARNALSRELMAALQAELEAIGDDRSVKVVVLAAAGVRQLRVGATASRELKALPTLPLGAGGAA